MEETGSASDSEDVLSLDMTSQTKRIEELERELLEYKETARELAKSEERYALAVRGTHDGIWDWEVGTDKVAFSPRFKALLGYPEGQSVGDFSEFTESLHPDDLEHTMDAIQAHLEKGVPYNVEYRLKNQSGNYLWFQARGEAVRDESGTPIRMAGAISDITRRKEVEQQLSLITNRLVLATRAGGIGVFDYDIVNNILVWDEHMYRIYGVDPDQFSGAYEAWEEGVHPDDLQAQREKLDRAMKGEKEFDTDFRIIWPSDGSIHYINANATVLRDKSGKAVRMIGANWDITESRQTQEDLRNARERAEAAAEAKSEFLANMSHEIRTPMNGIMGMTALLFGTDLDEIQLEYVNWINHSSESLLTIINDILDFSKIEAGKLSLDPHEFPLRDSLSDALQAISVEAAEKGIELALRVDAGVPDNLIGDLGRIRQVINNLAGNGIKFTSVGEVVVEVRLESRNDHQVVLHFLVNDTGIGIPPEKHQLIFESFNQAENSTTRNFGGTGLGLSISQRLVDLMNGRIWLESEPGRGSSFQFTLQLEVSGEENVEQAVSDGLSGKKVLVVDDVAITRDILESVLSARNMEIQSAASGVEALQKLTSAEKSGSPFQLVLLDIAMGKTKWIETARKIRKQVKDEGPAIILLSAVPHPLGRKQMSTLGIEKVLRKPVKESELLAAVSRKFGAASLERVEGFSKIPKEDLPPVRPMRLLLAEDGHVNQIVAVKLLEEAGHIVTLAEDGKIAVEKFLEQSFDAILMDVHMPGMDGYSATTAIRKAEEISGGHIPIIAMTANAMRGDRRKCIKAGMDDYIAKPVRPAVLFSILQKFSPPAGLSDASEMESEATGIEADAPEPDSGIFDPKAFKATFPSLELMRELIEYFPDETGTYLESAKKALGEGDVEALHHAAHSLKGTVGNYSANGAFVAAAELDRLARKGDLKEAVKVLEKCRQEVDQLGEVLRSFMETLEP